MDKMPTFQWRDARRLAGYLKAIGPDIAEELEPQMREVLEDFGSFVCKRDRTSETDECSRLDQPSRPVMYSSVRRFFGVVNIWSVVPYSIITPAPSSSIMNTAV